MLRVTTNLDEQLLHFLDAEAKNRSETRREFLEFLIRSYKQYKLKQEIISGLNALADDAEEMSDWLEIANNPINNKTSF